MKTQTNHGVIPSDAAKRIEHLECVNAMLVEACKRAERYFIEKERDGMTSDMALTVKIELTNALAEAEGGA